MDDDDFGPGDKMKNATRGSKYNASFCIVVLAVALTNSGAAFAAGVFDERGGLVVVEVESEPPETPWIEETFITGFTGTSYYRMDGNTDQGGTPVGRMSYFIRINDPGVYKLIMHSYKPDDDESRSNDCYTRMVGHSGYQGDDTKTYLPGPTRQWSWDTMHEPGQVQLEPTYTLGAGVHEFQISGRSRDFHIDRFVLFTQPVTRTQAEDLSLAESPLVGDPDPPDTGGDSDDTDSYAADTDSSNDTESQIETYILEAEHMTLDGFSLDADNPNFISTQNEGEAWTIFAGEDGFYHFSAVVGLEPDGRPRLALLVGDALVGEVTYELATDEDAPFVPHTVELGDAEVMKGEEILLHGVRDEQALARIDKIILTTATRDTDDTGNQGADTDSSSDSTSPDTGSKDTQTDPIDQVTDSDPSTLEPDTQSGSDTEPEDKNGSHSGCGCRLVSSRQRPDATKSTAIFEIIRLVSF